MQKTPIQHLLTRIEKTIAETKEDQLSTSSEKGRAIDMYSLFREMTKLYLTYEEKVLEHFFEAGVGHALQSEGNTDFQTLLNKFKTSLDEDKRANTEDPKPG